LASLRPAQHDPQAATATLMPVIDGSVGFQPFSVVAALLLEAMARGGSWLAGRRPRSKGSSLTPFRLGGVNHQNM